MAMNIKNEKVALRPSGKRRLAQALDFLERERESWPNIPRQLQGRRITKRERERILGYGKDGV
jgi:hypothetical protein